MYNRGLARNASPFFYVYRVGEGIKWVALVAEGINF